MAFVPTCHRMRRADAAMMQMPEPKSSKKPRNARAQEPPLTLAPLSFEEALTGLLQVAPPPKDERPEPEPEDKPKRKGRPKQADSEKGGR